MEQKVLIIRPGALGDTLMLLPALKDIGTSVQIMVAGRDPGLSFLKQTAAECHNFEGAGWHRLFQEKPDPHVPLPVPAQDMVVAYLNDEDGRIGNNLKGCFPGARIYIRAAYPAAEHNVHVARYLCETLAATGLPIDPDRAMERAKNRALLGGDNEAGPRDRIIVHPGSGSYRKNFPPEFWLAFLDRIAQEPALKGPKKGVVLLGPAEEALRNFFGKRIPRALGMVFCPRHDELISLLEQASLYAGHDSGVTHLAAMLGAPTVAVFRQDNLSMWHPVGPCTRAIHSRKPDEVCLENMLEAARSLIRRKP